MRARAWTAWELKSAFGMTTAQACAAWARKNNAEVLTDELLEGTKLHWIGPRREDRVILYFHGAHTTSFFSGSNYVNLNVDDDGVLRWGICSSS